MKTNTTVEGWFSKGRLKGVKVGVSFLIIIFFMVPVSFCQAEMVSISKEKVNARSGPGTKYDVLFEFGKGYPLKVLESKGKWIKVKDFEDDEGWVFRPLTTKNQYLIVKKKKINIRSGPGKKYNVIDSARHGVVFRLLKRKKAWVKVEDEEGFTGWIYRKLLWGR